MLTSYLVSRTCIIPDWFVRLTVMLRDSVCLLRWRFVTSIKKINLPPVCVCRMISYSWLVIGLIQISRKGFLKVIYLLHSETFQMIWWRLWRISHEQENITSIFGSKSHFTFTSLYWIIEFVWYTATLSRSLINNISRENFWLSYYIFIIFGI